ncbi:MAG: insulinase family protein, partial [Planctomycetia bacterium]|nr:insulinase family protein [Planctomycetia bacterium]
NQDRTYYYEIFPSNNLELGLWMESERMLHPVINEIGVETQNEVVKEEKRRSYDNRPYGRLIKVVFENIFEKHPYRWMTIGSMDHLDAATLDEFKAFNKKFYIPNNAALVVAGDIDIPKTKVMIGKYFGSIPSGESIKHTFPVEDEISEEIVASTEDPNIQIPAVIITYRTPAMTTRDAYVLDMISSILSDGKSSRLYKKLVDNEKKALQVMAFNYSLEDYGAYIVLALPLGENTLDDLANEIDEEIVDLQNNLISERDMQKLYNKFENNFINSNSSIAGIAHSLASYHVLYDDTNLINTEIDIYNSITREKIRAAAKKYLLPNKRLVLDYLPETENN